MPGGYGVRPIEAHFSKAVGTGQTLAHTRTVIVERMGPEVRDLDLNPPGSVYFPSESQILGSTS